MAKVYQAVNGAAGGAAAPVAVTSGTAIKTMIQLSTSANREARVVEWWWEGDASAAATPVKVETFYHSGGAATVTAFVAGDILKYEANAPNSQLTLGTTASGYTASAEGTITGARGGTAHFVPPTSGIYMQYPLGREPEIPVSQFMRIRNTAGTAVNVYCGVAWEE